jgi:hypothetical protein
MVMDGVCHTGCDGGWQSRIGIALLEEERLPGSMGATRQLDFVFASEALAERITVRALNTSDRES